MRLFDGLSQLLALPRQDNDASLLPSAYSFWASMMTRTESFTLAVESGMPAICRNDAAMMTSFDWETGRLEEGWEV